MRKINTLLFSAMALGISMTSCTKSEEEKTASAIIGKWTFSTVTQTSGGTTSAEGPATDPSCTDKDYLDLRSDKSCEEQMIGTDLNNPCAPVKATGTYTYQDKKININVNGQTANYTIVSVSSSKLVINIPTGSDNSEYYTVTCIK